MKKRTLVSGNYSKNCDTGIRSTVPADIVENVQEDCGVGVDLAGPGSRAPLGDATVQPTERAAPLWRLALKWLGRVFTALLIAFLIYRFGWN